MRRLRPLRDPHLRAVTDAVAEAFGAAFADFDLSRTRPLPMRFANEFSAGVPASVLRGALAKG